MSRHRDHPLVTHRHPPRDYVESGPRPAPALTREQKLVLGLLACIALTGAALIWIGVR